PGPLQDCYHGLLARGMRAELARVTLTRKLAALTLRLWQKGEPSDPAQLTIQAREHSDLRGGGVGRAPRRRLQDPGRRCEGQSRAIRSPGPQSAEVLA
ncbi:MAG: hypothetical protein ACRET3_10905, partial [Burkholderiales bacterium]